MTDITDSRFAPSVVEDATGVPIAEPEGNAEPPTDTVPDITKEDRQAAVTEAYTEASKTLRENHRDEFISIQKGLLAERGIEWSPKPTKQERAKAAARKALTEAGLPIPSELA